MAKKKIKDITIEEARRICGRHLCNECSLYKMDAKLKGFRACLLDTLDRIPDWMLDEEIEIPDEPAGNSDQLEEENNGNKA